MYIDSTQLNLTGALLQRNAASMRGGAVAIVGTSKSSTVSLTRINFVGNAAGENGGVIYIESSKVEIVHSYARAYRDAGTLKRQSAGGSGGFLYAKTSELTVSNVTAKETLSSGAGTIGCFGTLINAARLTLESNEARSGGAIFGLLCTVRLAESLIASNIAVEGDGGGIELVRDSEIIAVNSTFRGQSQVEPKQQAFGR